MHHLHTRTLRTVSDTHEKTVRRNFFALGAGEAAARLIAFAATVYLARTLGPGAYGIIGLATAVLLYFTYVADCGIETLGVREIASDPTRAQTLAPAVLTLRLAVAALLAVLVAILGLALLPQPDGAILAVYGLTLVGVGANTRWIHLGLEDAPRVAIARIIGESTMVLLVVLLVRSAGDLARVPLAQFTGDLLAMTLLAIWLRRRGVSLPLRWDRAAAAPVLRRAFPLVLHALLGLMIYNSDLIFLRTFWTPADVGQYVAAYTLISFLLNLGIAYSQSLLPTLTRLGTEPVRQHALYQTAMAQVFAASFPIAVGGFLLAPGLIGFVFGPGYQGSTIVLEILIWTVPVAFYRNVPQMALISAGRQQRVLRITFVSAMLNLALNILIIPEYGMVGAALATLGTELVRTGLALWYARHEGFALPSPSRLWRTLLAGGGMGAVLYFAGLRWLWVGIAAGALVYLALLALVGGIQLRKGSVPALTV
jgi:O-antigen/teichoic acid export membrane protein